MHGNVLKFIVAHSHPLPPPPNFMLSKLPRLGFAIFDLLVVVGLLLLLLFPKTTEKPNSKLEKHDFLNMVAMETSSSENND